MRGRRTHTLAIAALLALPLALTAQAQAAYPAPGTNGSIPAVEPDLDALRAASERFRDVRVALAEGYVADTMCAVAGMEGLPPELGAMGIHYFRPDLLEITATEPRVKGTGTHTDMLRPAILFYEPQADGGMELLGVENLVFADAWWAAGNTAVPTFQGNRYLFRTDDPTTEVDEAHGFAPHYELHVWLYRDNPAGMFAPYNPAVACEHVQGAHGEH